MRESNSRQRFWRPLSYHLTNPLCIYKSYLHTISYLGSFVNNNLVPSKPHIKLSDILTWTIPGQALDLLVLVSCKRCRSSTSNLSTLSSARGLTAVAGISHLEGGFTLRCLQRLSRPNLATLPWAWRPNRYTRGSSIPVLSY